jgi:hypothetical protein
MQWGCKHKVKVNTWKERLLIHVPFISIPEMHFLSWKHIEKKPGKNCFLKSCPISQPSLCVWSRNVAKLMMKLVSCWWVEWKDWIAHLTMGRYYASVQDFGINFGWVLKSMWRWHLLLDTIMPSNRYLCCMVALCACIISCLFYSKFSKDVFQIWGEWVASRCNESITTMLLLPSLRTSWIFEVPYVLDVLLAKRKVD